MQGTLLPPSLSRVLVLRAVVGLSILFGFIVSAHARPRSPQPPFPEPILKRWTFDDTNSAALRADGVLASARLIESWSGYAVHLDPNAGAVVTSPVTAGDGRPVLLPGRSSIRFWHRPGWTSTGAGGSGPRQWVKLLEMDQSPATGTGLWLTLGIDPAGDSAVVRLRTGQRVATVVRAPIVWSTNAWHEVVLTFAEQDLALFVDGVLAGEATDAIEWPDEEAWRRVQLSFGAGLDGQNVAVGDWDEVSTLSVPLAPDYIAWNYQRLARLAALGPVADDELVRLREAAMGVQTMSVDGPPPPPGGGGGGGTNQPPPESPPAPPGLKLTVPRESGGTLAMSLREADTNDAYDVFQKTALAPGYGWKLAAAGGVGQTNFNVTMPATNTAFYRAASALDSDGDGLSDAFEVSVTGTATNLFDTDSDGFSDALEDANGDGVPNYAEAARNVAVCVYASRPTATEGGLNGEFTILLPQPAPTGGVRVDYLLGGGALLGEEFSLSPGPYSLTIPAGNSSATLAVAAVNDSIGDELDRVVELRITNATQFAWDERPAEVTLVNNDPPTVRVLAADADAGETRAGTTNAAEFLFVRDAGFSQALTIFFSVGGTAGTADYPSLGTSVTIPAGQRATSLFVRPVQDSDVEGVETVVVTLLPNGAYSLDPSNNLATVTIADDDLPIVQIFATDYDAREAGLDPGQFQITRTGGTGQPLTVYYAAYGTASPSNFVYGTSNIVQDYQPLSGVATIPAGSSSVNIPVTPLSDAQLETMETVVTVLRGSTAYTIGASNTATVYIDDSNPAQFGYEVLQFSAAAGYAGGLPVDVPGEVILRRFGTSRSQQDVGWLLWCSDSIFMSSNLPSGFLATGPRLLFNNGFQTNGVVRLPPYVWEASIAVHAGVNWRPLGGVGLKITNVIDSVPIGFFNPSQLYSVSVIQRVAIEGGQSAVVRVSRPIPNASAYLGDVYLRLKGPAMPDAGYSPMNDRILVTVPANQTFKDVSLTALTRPGFQGWRRLYVEVDPLQQLGAADHRAGAVSCVEVFVTDPSLPLPQPAVDTDQDGLADDYESLNGLDPQRADDPFADPDRDGLNHLEEQAAGSRANNADTDGDGAGDFLEYLSDWRSATNQTLAALSLDNSTPVRLKVSSCYKCHATGMQVGDYALMSMPEYRRYTAEEVARLAKGRSYPVRVYTEFDPFSPTNLQLYGAEILAVTNPPGFLLEDPDGILGPQRVATSNLMAKTAWLHIPRIELAVDANRDGVISFLPGTNDQTSASRPYTFWVNDDLDLGSDDTATDLDPTGVQPDSVDTIISNQRDLEDFTRLHLKLDAVNMSQLQQGTLAIALELRNATNVPGIRIFRSSLTNGAATYLTSETIAAQQLSGGYGTALGQISSIASFTLPASFWSGATGSNAFRPFLFEGTGVGDGQLVAVLKQGATSVAESAPVHLKLRKVTDLFEHFTVGDTNDMEWNRVPFSYARTYDSGVYGVSSPQTSDYILFVHGWRMRPWERRAFAATAFKRLNWQGYQGRFGFYSWPTEYTPVPGVPPENYDRSERKAWLSARGLRHLLLDLSKAQPDRVRVFAHSMGNVVVSETLKLHGSRSTAPVVHTYVASQAASVAHAYDAAGPETVETDASTDTPESYARYPLNQLPYYAGMTNAVRINGVTLEPNIVNFHNRADFALNSWLINQDTKPDAYWTYSKKVSRWERRNLGPNAPLFFPQDRYEIYAHIAEARSRALGAAERDGFVVRGQIGDQVNLFLGPFNYAGNDYEHSAEFRSTNMRRFSYWNQMLTTFGLIP